MQQGKLIKPPQTIAALVAIVLASFPLVARGASENSLLNSTLPLPELDSAHLTQFVSLRSARRTPQDSRRAAPPSSASVKAPQAAAGSAEAHTTAISPAPIVLSPPAPPAIPPAASDLPPIRMSVAPAQDIQPALQTAMPSRPVLDAVDEEPAISVHTLLPDTAVHHPQQKPAPDEHADLPGQPEHRPKLILSVLPSPLPPAKASFFERCPLLIDNDEASEQQQTIKYEPLTTDASGSKAEAGARFPVVLCSEISTKTAKSGDPVQGRLKYDLKIGQRLVAKKGSLVRGHVNYCLRARTPMRSLVSIHRWYRTSGCLGISFDEIVNEHGEHIPVVAEPAQTARYVKNKAEGRELGINHKGQIAGPWSQQLRYKAIRIGLNFALSPCGAFSFGAMPVALGVLGAANPSFAFGKPIGCNVRHRRIKGFVWGALSGVPGSFLIEDTTIKGQEVIVEPGDEFLAEIREEFTGEPGSEAEMAGANTKVHGEVVNIDSKRPAPKTKS